MEDNVIVQAVEIGSIMVDIVVKSQTKRIRLKDILHLPKMKKSLFLINKLILHGFKVHFSMNRCFIKIFDRKYVNKNFYF